MRPLRLPVPSSWRRIDPVANIRTSSSSSSGLRPSLELLEQMHLAAEQDEAHEPLIARESESRDRINNETTPEHLAAQEDDNNNDNDLPSKTSSKPIFNKALWLLTLSASLSGLLFGYDTGVISSTLISLEGSLSRPLTTWDKSAITSSTSLLALMFSPLAGYFADTLGRRAVIAAASLLFIAGALLQAASTRVWIMIAGRSIVGAAVGLASAISPLYIAEISPAEMRGQLVTVQSLFITGGQVVAYLVGWAVQGKWRWAVGAGALPALLQAVLLIGMEESPRWLVQKGRDEDARKVLERLGGSSKDTNTLIESIRDEVNEEGGAAGKGGLKYSLGQLLHVPGYRRALIIACMLQGFQQLCGFNSVSAKKFCAVRSPILTLSAYVLFCHHLFIGRLHFSHRHISVNRPDEFHLHSRLLCRHRPYWPPQDPSLFHAIHVSRSHCLFAGLYSHPIRRRPRSSSDTKRWSVVDYTARLADSIRCFFRNWSRLRTMAAIGTLPAISKITRIWSGDNDELVLERSDCDIFLAYDAGFWSELDLFDLCGYLRNRVVYCFCYLSRDGGTGARRRGQFACTWMGRSG